jgi:hypothetical protein
VRVNVCSLNILAVLYSVKTGGRNNQLRVCMLQLLKTLTKGVTLHTGQ